MRLACALAVATLTLTGCAALPSAKPPQKGATRTVPVSPAQRPGSGTRPSVKLYAPGVRDGAPNSDDIPADVANTPDAIPKAEPRSKSGNPDQYEAFGIVYDVLDDTDGFKQRGRASWYGKKFQGRKTASGEPYDMFAMTAAHKTLPIPRYRSEEHTSELQSLMRISYAVFC